MDLLFEHPVLWCRLDPPPNRTQIETEKGQDDAQAIEI